LCKLAPETALFPLRRASRGVRLAGRLLGGPAAGETRAASAGAAASSSWAVGLGPGRRRPQIWTPFVRAEQRPRSPGGAGSSPARGTRQRRRKKRRHMQYEGAEISLGSVRPPRSTEKVKPLEPRSRKAPNPNVD
ncbi:unnamed protein product, partial [Prorocentrum cordatum]